METLGVKATRRTVAPASTIPEAAVANGAHDPSHNGNGTNGSAPGAGKRGIYTPECPAQKALDAIASKWAILIMHRLQTHGMLRFNALQRDLPGISQKVLTQQLRRLEKFGLVHREVKPTVPPSVEYSLTEAGSDLKVALKALCEWASTHAEALRGGQPQTQP